jgi:hypothetical protein
VLRMLPNPEWEQCSQLLSGMVSSKLFNRGYDGASFDSFMMDSTRNFMSKNQGCDSTSLRRNDNSEEERFVVSDPNARRFDAPPVSLDGVKSRNHVLIAEPCAHVDKKFVVTRKSSISSSHPIIAEKNYQAFRKHHQTPKQRSRRISLVKPIFK